MQSAAADATDSDDSSGTGSDGDQPHADSEESGDGATSSGSGGEQHPELTQQKHGKATAAVQNKVGKASATEEGRTTNASAAMAASDIEEVQDALALSALDKLLAARWVLLRGAGVVFRLQSYI